MITTRWKHLENMRMAYFIMDKKKVTVLFAHLVMLLMRSSAFLTAAVHATEDLQND